MVNTLLKAQLVHPYICDDIPVISVGNIDSDPKNTSVSTSQHSMDMKGRLSRKGVKGKVRVRTKGWGRGKSARNPMKIKGAGILSQMRRDRNILMRGGRESRFEIKVSHYGESN